MSQEKPSSEPVLIKKYGNRRLYDTNQSRYITLEDLASIVQAGATVKVVEASGGKEITRQVLTQVILEQQDRLDMIPIELLHAIIRTQGTLQQGPFSMFLSSMAQQATSAHSMWTQQMANMFGGMFPFGSPQPSADQPASQPDESAAKAAAEGRDTMQELRERLDALVKAKEELEKKKKKG